MICRRPAAQHRGTGQVETGLLLGDMGWENGKNTRRPRPSADARQAPCGRSQLGCAEGKADQQKDRASAGPHKRTVEVQASIEPTAAATGGLQQVSGSSSSSSSLRSARAAAVLAQGSSRHGTITEATAGLRKDRVITLLQ